MNLPLKETVEQIRQSYPVGTWVELLEMNDPHTRLTPGMKGMVTGIDSIGTLMMSWQNGSDLGVAHGADRVKKLDGNYVPLSADQLFEMHGLPVWLIPMDADLRHDDNISYYLVNANDQTLTNADWISFGFDAVSSKHVFVYRQEPRY